MYGPFIASTPDYRIWSPETQEPFETQEIPTRSNVSGLPPNNYFQHNLMHSLGYLNGTMGAPVPAAIATASPMYEGAPQRPFPWLAWNNRPFANPLEMMQVPSSTPSRLLHEFEVYRDTNDMVRATDDPYDAVVSPPPPLPSAPVDIANFRGTFRHLLNFFHTLQGPLLERSGRQFLSPVRLRGNTFAVCGCREMVQSASHWQQC